MSRPLRAMLFVVALLAIATMSLLLPIENKVALSLLVGGALLLYSLVEVGCQLFKDARWLGRWIRKQLRRRQSDSQP
ncbi:MAG: hypothetical protein K2X72_09975 [Reyranella sp.]|nr:hypothetical protein [Reyranella sp.]